MASNPPTPNRPHNSISAPVMAILTPISRDQREAVHEMLRRRREEIATQTMSAEEQMTVQPINNPPRPQEQQNATQTDDEQTVRPTTERDEIATQTSAEEQTVQPQQQQQAIELDWNAAATPQQTPQRAEMAAQNDGPTPIRAVKSSPQLLTTNSEELRVELRNALAPQPNHRHGQFGAEPRMSRDYEGGSFNGYHGGGGAGRGNDDDYFGLPPVGPVSSMVNSSVLEFGRVHSMANSALEWLVPRLSSLWEYRLFRFFVALLAVYVGMGFVEQFAVAATAAFVRWTWPPVHFMLGSSRGCLYHLTDWFTWMDDFLSSWVCDMAIRYCYQYGIMCECHCSFVDRAAERSALFGRRF